MTMRVIRADVTGFVQLLKAATSQESGYLGEFFVKSIKSNEVYPKTLDF